MAKLKRSLQSRHLVMIALGGSIGTGLFLATGSAIHVAGPGGAILAYILISIMVYLLMTSLGEMAAFSPTTGSFCEYSADYVDKSFGFAMSWNYWFNWSITVATEVVAAGIIMQFWFPDVPTIYWSAFFFVLIFTLNCMPVKFYGESEYLLSFIKVSSVVIFIVVGFLAIFGLVGNFQEVGFHNWHVGDAPFNGGFIAFFAVFLVAGFSFQGTETVGIAAGEAENPRKSVPKAIKSTFWRIVIFYILSIGVLTFLVPYNSSLLVAKEGVQHVASSPFTIVFSEIGITWAASIMNVVILIAVLSACNASMYAATRTLWYMGKTKVAPKSFYKVNSFGVPFSALLLTSLIGCLFILQYIFPNGTIFIWLVGLSSLSGFIAWFGIAWSHFRFRRAYVLQGRSLKDLPYQSKFFPYGPVIAMLFIVVIIFGQLVYGTPTFKEFFSTYCGVILFLILWVSYKMIKKTKYVKLKNIQIKSKE